MFNLFISLYQDNVKNAGIRDRSTKEFFLLAVMSIAALLECIGSLFLWTSVTIIAFFILVASAVSLYMHEKSLNKKYNFFSLMELKRTRLKRLQATVQMCSLWSEQGLLWLEEMCKEQITFFNDKRRRFGIPSIVVALVSFIGALGTFLSTLVQIGLFNFSDWDMPEFISVNEKYIPYIFVGILFIAFVILTVGWLNSLLRVDYAQIKDELSYLRITTFH